MKLILCCFHSFYVFLLLVTFLRFETVESSYVCFHFYNNAIKTLTSVVNNSVRLSVFSLPHPVSFAQARQICQKCADGELVQEDESPLLIDFLPTWIEVAKNNESTLQDLYQSGTRLVNTPTYNVTDIIFPRTFSTADRYAIYAIHGNRSSVRRNQDDYEWRSENQTNLRWVALQQDFNPGSVLSREVYNRLTYDDTYPMRNMRYIVCQRPVRLTCHQWNITDERCQNIPGFGCHKYTSMMLQSSDNAEDKTCEPPSHRRHASKCLEEECVCKVTKWSAWSACGDETCKLGAQTRSRGRSLIDRNCDIGSSLPKLTQSQKCQVSGCDALEHAQQKDDDDD